MSEEEQEKRIENFLRWVSLPLYEEIFNNKKELNLFLIDSIDILYGEKNKRVD